MSLILSSEIWWIQCFVCALQDWRLYLPKSCGSLVIKSHWPSRSDSLGNSSPFVGFQAEKPAVGFRIFTTVEVLIWYYCSPIFQPPTKWVWDLILSWLCPSYCFTEASSLSLGMEYLFLVGSSVLVLMVVQQLVLILVLSPEEMNTSLSTLPSWTRSYYISIGLIYIPGWLSLFPYRLSSTSILSRLLLMVIITGFPNATGEGSSQCAKYIQVSIFLSCKLLLYRLWLNSV